tara:strand:- start:457 stop:672 length:216 start_codon:yes stop_codon:yes gene_type:complete
MVMDMMLEDAIKESKMWEINNPRVHALLRNFMLFVDHSETIDDTQTQEVLSYLLTLTRAYGDPNFKVPVNG